jgi:hypothetical protein
MLGIILTIAPCFFIWRYFAELAHEHNRSRAGFGVLGIATFIVSQFILGFVIGLVMVTTGMSFSFGGTIVLSLVGVAFGALCCWILFILLKRAWMKSPKNASDLLDS